MKLTPGEQKIQGNFLPGVITRDGFLGSDSRHIHDIVLEDARTLERMGLSPGDIADRLQFFLDEGKKGLESPVSSGAFTVQVEWHKGALPCPFGESGLHQKIMARLCSKRTGQCIRFSQLNIHLIRKHGFFEGKGSPLRLDPQELAVFLKG
ncbi:hypothetical protein JW906_06715 [bacterium]|nr:hypothetical protein [bacterium]